MPKNKSPGLDGLPVEFYQKFWNELEDFFAILLDTRYTEGQLSNTQRKSVITLLYKKGERTNISNYRPLSLTGTDNTSTCICISRKGTKSHSQAD